MAFTGTTAAILSNYDEVLKTFYLPAIQEQLNNETILTSVIDTNEEDVSGKDATIECHYGRSKGTGSRKDGGALPEADYQKFKTCTVPMKYHYGRITFSGPTLAATRDDRGAYARVMDAEIRGIVMDLKREINRQMWGAGYGMLAKWSSGSSTSIVVEKRYRGATNGDGFGGTFGGKYFEENGGAVMVTPGSAAASAFVTLTVGGSDLAVTAVTEGTVTDTLTMDDPGSPAAGSYFVRPANLVAVNASSAAGAARVEMMGLRGIVTDTDLDEISLYDGSNTGLSVNDPLQGLAVDTYTWFRANVDKHSSGTRYGGQRALSLELVDKMFHKVERKAGKGRGPKLILTTQALEREYAKLVRAERRYVNTMAMDGGWEALDHHGVPLTTDEYDAIDGEMYFLTPEDLQIYRMSDYDWMQKDGAILSRISGYDAYEAVLFRYAELGCVRRNTHGVIADLNYTAT